MSGSGATCFGVFDDPEAAARAARAHAPGATVMVGDQHRDAAGMIVLCTDFGLEGPYTGQVKAVLARAAPAVPVVDLFADLPPFRPQGAAYLLAAYGAVFKPGDVILTVVDPGVGGARAALALEADGRWYVGPDNGIFELVLRRAQARAAGGSTGGRPRCRRRSTVVICSRRWPPRWRWAKPRAGRRRRRRVIRTGRTTSPRSSMSIVTATP